MKEYIVFFDGRYWERYTSMRSAKAAKEKLQELYKNVKVTIKTRKARATA